jgi:hypothetical protein
MEPPPHHSNISSSPSTTRTVSFHVTLSDLGRVGTLTTSSGYELKTPACLLYTRKGIPPNLTPDILDQISEAKAIQIDFGDLYASNKMMALTSFDLIFFSCFGFEQIFACRVYRKIRTRPSKISWFGTQDSLLFSSRSSKFS